MSLAVLIVLIAGGLAILGSAPDTNTLGRKDGSEPTWSGAETDATVSATRTVAPRAIAPEQFATPFAQDAVRLERIAPRAPLTPTVERETGPRPTLLHKPLVIAAGEVVFPEGGLRLKGIVVTDPDDTCTDAEGRLWPCGIIARTAFRNFISGRSLSCILPEERWRDIVVVSCLVGKQDPAAWLASRGWARTFVGSKYADLEQTAQQEARGIYGSDPRGPSVVPDSRLEVSPDAVSPLPAPLPVPLR
ncbi:hypothetical protein [Hoeflea sp.]|uniref:hypothetical protein n=1 Tax=Hoeflea sp. TaxID=1940281 RepID=UPI003B016FD9